MTPFAMLSLSCICLLFMKLYRDAHARCLDREQNAQHWFERYNKRGQEMSKLEKEIWDLKGELASRKSEIEMLRDFSRRMMKENNA